MEKVHRYKKRLQMRLMLIDAVAAGDKEKVISLLLKGVNPNRRSRGRNTPLITACSKENIPMVRLLLERGACPNQRDCNNAFPLMVATYRANSDLVALLLHHKANPDLPDLSWDYETPLICASRKYKPDSEYPRIITLLLQHKANINLKNKVGCTALAFACVKNLQLTQALLEAGANPNSASKKDNTPLMWIVKKYAKTTDEEYQTYSIAAIELLRKYGADPTIKNNLGDSPVSLATKRCYFDILYALR
jgi:ankyrin repeat protein